MSYFSVDILTPSRVVGRDLKADFLSIPTSRGEIQILPEHTDLITKLDTGILSLRNGQEMSFLVTTGVCKILDHKVLILSKLCEMPQDEDASTAKETLVQLQEKLKSSQSLSPDEMKDLQEKIKRAEIRLKLSSLKKS